MQLVAFNLPFKVDECVMMFSMYEVGFVKERYRLVLLSLLHF